jgi:hypothetical protein
MPGSGSMACPKPIKGMHSFTRRKNAAQRLADAYELVNQRDENRSRVSGCTLLPSSPDPRQRREHHHLSGRNVSPQDRDNPARIILVSALEHGFLESGALLHEGDDARKRIVFHWDKEFLRQVDGKPPIRIQSKRWSQNDDE